MASAKISKSKENRMGARARTNRRARKVEINDVVEKHAPEKAPLQCLGENILYILLIHSRRISPLPSRALTLFRFWFDLPVI